MIRRAKSLAIVALALLAIAAPAASAIVAEEPCELQPRAKCFGLKSVEASLSTTQAGNHPDLTLTFDLKQDPESAANNFGLKDAYEFTRNVRFELPPGLVGDPNTLGGPQQCPSAELARGILAECPNGSQVGVTKIQAYDFEIPIVGPVYMMAPPDGDVVARLGLIAGLFPIFVDFQVRSESDYGLIAEFTNASTAAQLVRVEATTWGVPAAAEHDTERCTPAEANPLIGGCLVSEPRPPGSLKLPFLTNPTRCGVPLEMHVSVSSWAEPDRFDTKSASFPEVTDCNRLPFGPSLTAEPTTQHAASPTGLDMMVRLPASDGINVLEPSQIRDIRINLPTGMAVNPGSADGLGTCSLDQVKFGTREPAACPDAAKLASTEFDIPALPRRMKGAIYLREPEPGNLFRVWVVADDLGAHVKLPGQLEVDKQTGQISSVVVDLPQVPMRETRLFFKSGFRAPLVTPPTCDANPSTPKRDPYLTPYEFVPWSGGPSVKGSTPMTIDEGCEGLGGFAPKLSAGTTDPTAGKHSPFLFTLTRQDGEQNPARIDITLPQGLAAKLAGVPRCNGLAAQTGNCPPGSQIGTIKAASGYGTAPLWVPQPGKDPTSLYLGGPYKGAPLSIVAVVPAQAGSFDLGDIVVRSTISVDPTTAQAAVRSEPIPQIIEGIPIRYRTIHVILDRPDFTLNPTGCAAKQVLATVGSAQGALATPFSPFRAANCASLGFRPRIGLRLVGGTKRGGHPSLRTVLRPRRGDANISRTVVKLPSSAFLDQAHIGTVCTRVQFAADACPAGAVYGRVRAFTPLFEEPLEGPAILRSSTNLLPDLVFDLRGPASLPIEIEAAARIDSVKGGIRATFPAIPDAPLTEVVVNMRGGNRGLIVNSRDLCRAKNRANVKLTAHNGRRRNLRPAVRASCGKKGKRRRARRSSHRR